MNNDAELLRRYVAQKSEPAFTELVQRHIGLVYSVALRRVGGDAHLAEDVAQKVFGDLARKAPSLLERASLSGWLFTSTHLASAGVVRGEQRRKTRETEAHLMQTTLSPDESHADWTRLRPVVDDVIAALKEEDREAIALRFFEKRSFAEVGAALRVSEEAARKRVDRSLDKLRALLELRGVTSTTAALGVALIAVGTATVPATLTAKVAAHAIGQAAASTGGSVTGTLASALLPVAATLIIGGLVIGSQRTTHQELRGELAQIIAENRATSALRVGNIELARAVTIAKETRPRQAAAVAPPSPSAVVPPSSGPRAVSAQVTVSTKGTLAWDGRPVKLAEFIAHLRQLQATADPESRIVVQAQGAEFSALAYVIDEIRKAQLNHVTVESDAAPNPNFGWSWF